MTAMAPSIETLVERLEKLERENRRLRRAGATVVALGSAVLVLAGIALQVGWWPPAVSRRVVDVIEAKRFVLRDPTGAIQAELRAEAPGFPSLIFFDQDGKQRARLGMWGLYLADPAGKQRASLGLIPGATPSDAPSPVLHLNDTEGAPRGTLMIAPDGASRLFLSDKDGKAGAAVEAEADGSPRVALFDRDGRGAAWLGALPDGSRALFITDRAEKTAGTFGITADGSLRLTLTDGRNQERATLGLLPDGAPHLNLSGPDAQGGANLSLSARGSPVFGLFDAEGKASAVLMAVTGSSSLLLRDENAKEVAGLSTQAGRWPRLFLSGDGDRLGALLSVSPDGAPGLALFDRAGTPRATLGQIAPNNVPGRRAPQ